MGELQDTHKAGQSDWLIWLQWIFWGQWRSEAVYRNAREAGSVACTQGR